MAEPTSTLPTQQPGGAANGQLGVAPGAPGATAAPTSLPFRRRRKTEWARAFAILGNLLVFLAAGSFIAVGFGQFGYTPDRSLRIAGYLGLFLVFTVGPIALAVTSPARRRSEERVAARFDRLTDAIRLLTEQSTLSGDARRVLNRRIERDLLCRAIEEDIAAAEWDAALVLCAELADRFGYRAEAEEFRSRIEFARSEILDRNVADSIGHLDGLIVQRRWDAAAREAARIMRLFPDSPRVEHLRQRVDQARAAYKADLERRFLEAADQDRIEDAMTLLKELDAYLTENEAEPFREVARGVIGKARDNLGAQFKLAVRDRQWATAAALGRRIINEFPNTRMASEVREMLDGILAKANAGAAV
jgi:hypothetical protein